MASLEPVDVELVELEALTLRTWVELTGHEREPFGSVSAGLQWRAKERHVGLRRRSDERLVAVAGAVVVSVDVDGAGRFDVVGLGALIIAREARGRGLMVVLMDGLAELATRMGPDLAVIFCRGELLDLYRRRGYEEIAAAVWVDQPDGRVEMPEHAMWRPIRPAPPWPPGRVEVHGLPF